MRLLFSGADNYMVPQKDSNRSLGGQMSNTPIPNSKLNAIFTDLSKNMTKGSKNTYAIFLFNDSDKTYLDVNIQQIYQNYNGKDVNECVFRFAVVEPNDKGSIELIGNNLEEPYYADFFEPITKREQAYITFTASAIKGETLTFLGKTFTTSGHNYDTLIPDFINAFKNDDNYEIYRLGVNKMTVKKKKLTFNQNEDLTISGSFFIQYQKEDFSGLQGETIIYEELEPGKAIGLWIQREFMPVNEEDNTCLKMEDQDFLTEEDLEIIINWELPQPL